LDTSQKVASAQKVSDAAQGKQVAGIITGWADQFNGEVNMRVKPRKARC
jgi:hypothetical protein